MSVSIKISTGPQGEEDTITVDWFDHNNIRHKTEIGVRILNQDKPRTLAITVNGVTVATLDSNHQDPIYS